MIKPRVFIGSSVEGLPIAYAIQENLKFVAETTVWDQGAFNLSETTLESLLVILESSDFGVFVFSPDDYVKIRGKKDLAVRDNVLFELGLFVGKLGRKRSFVVVPDNKEFHLPTDLIGMTPGKYEANRSDNNMQAGTGSASHKIRESISKLGSLNDINKAPELVSNIEKKDVAQKNDWLDYLVKKEYDKSIKILKNKIRYTKGTDEKNDLKGWFCFAEFQKDPIKGTQEYEKLISDNSSDNTAYIPYIDNLIWINAFNKAIEICDLALSKCEKKITLTDLKAKCLWEMNKKEEAITLLNNSLINLPDVQLFLSLADKYIALDETKNAFDILHRAFFQFPMNEKVMYKFATTAYTTKQKEICVFLYKELLVMTPGNSTYWCLLGNSYLDLDLDNLALTAYEKACELAKNKEGWIFGNIGNLLNNKSLYDKAETNLKIALSLDEKSDYAHNRLSLVYSSKQEENKKVNDILATAKAKINSNSII
jgi:tetratricopeptide (TPR) repeat protein